MLHFGVCVCVCVSLCAHVHEGACRSQERVLDLLELELQMTVNHHVENNMSPLREQ